MAGIVPAPNRVLRQPFPLSMRWLAGLVLILCLTGCGLAGEGPTATPAVAQQEPLEVRDVETLLADVEVVKEERGVPDLTREDMAAIRKAARAANPGGRIRGIVTGIEHICGERWLRVVFEPHRTGERIRRYRSLSASWTKGAWEVGGLGTGLEVAPPWRSFEGGLPPLESEIQDLWYDPDLPDETLLAIVDLVRDRIPDGERIWTIELFGDFRYELEAQLGRPRVPGVDVYEVSTIRGCSGTDYRVEHEDGRWTVEETGEWIS